MFQRFVNIALEKATGKAVIVLLALYLIFNAVVMGWGAKKINALSGKEVQILDLCLTGYSPEEVNAYLSDYSPEARSFAAKFNAIADTAYPIVYTIMLTVLLAWVYKSRIQLNKSYRYLLLLPLLMMVLDYLENYHIIAMLHRYPGIPEDIVEAGSMLTVAKWGMFGVILITIFLGFALRAINSKKRVK
jgi:ABC-type sugar transport system permease subunit